MAELESPTQYITHHLTHLQVGTGFWTWDVDTLFMSTLLAIVVAVLFWIGARRSRPDAAPHGLALFAEHVYDWIDGQVAESYRGERSFMNALSISLFCWIVAMNAMDVIPVDVPAALAHLAGAGYWRVLPSADINDTFAMALVVAVLIVIFGVRAKGIGGFLHEWIAVPLGANPLLWIPNIFMNVLELFSRPVSLALRLFGNMFAGELLFLLVAVFTLNAVSPNFKSAVLFIVQVILGALWSGFDTLIILLQGYIFMVLPIVYLVMAEEHHG